MKEIEIIDEYLALKGNLPRRLSKNKESNQIPQSLNSPTASSLTSEVPQDIETSYNNIY